MAGEEEGGSLNEFVPDDMDDTGGLLPELQLMDASYVSHVPEAPEAFATEEGEDGEDGEEDEEGEEREECEEGEEGEEGEGEGSKASEALVTQTQRAPVSGNADGLDSASELWIESDSSTGTSSESEEDADVVAEVAAVERSKRNALKVHGADLTEQSVLEGGYLLPAADDRAQLGPQNSEHADSNEATSGAEEMSADHRATRSRRVGLDWTAVSSNHRPKEDVAPLHLDRDRDQLKKDPASAFQLSWEPDDEFPIFVVQATVEPAQLEKAVLHYRSLPPAQSRRYHCLVNLACCLASLNQPRPARSLLEQAILLQPHRAAARLNLIYCLLRVRDRPNAVIAIDEALRHAEDLSAEDHRLLLWTKKDLLKMLASKRGAPNRFGARGKRPERPDSGSGSSGRQTRRRPVTGRQMLSRVEAWQMRKDLAALRSNDTAEEVNPPWRRRHLYSEDSEQAISSKKARWQPLSRQELEAVRKAFADMAKVNAGEVISDLGEDLGSEDSQEQDDIRGNQEAAQRAYAAVKTLPCMQALAQDKAVALLQAGELLEVPGGCQIFEQGDIAEHIFIVIQGSVVIKILIPELGPDVIPVETLYDGQVFGDAKVAAWRDAQEGPPRRKAGALAQEDTCLLRICAGDYRQAMGLVDQPTDPSPRAKPTEAANEQDDQSAALLPDVQRKVQALTSSPFFEGASINNLALLASNVEEIVLRYDDVFLEIGQAIHACFLVSEGYVRVSVPVADQEAGMGSVEDVSRIIGMGRVPGSLLDGSAQSSAQDSGSGTATQSRPNSASRRMRADKLPSARANHANANSRANKNLRALRQRQEEASQLSRFKLKATEGSELPVFQLGSRPLLLPVTHSTSVASGASQRPSRFMPRKPGTPRRGTTWQAALRQRRTAPFLGIAPPDVELCQLHVGECFGLAALYDPKGECPYPSGCEVRVQSSEARILVLTNGSLLYLNEALARTLVDRAKEQQDPVAPLKQEVKRERTHRSSWRMQKLRVLDRIIMHE
ncbi:NMA1 [Symbiodinium natans]|uniref:NMA1 protein n=1 Tax=Symbiodinium natans TaxID=878477 RepID=A0A812PW65_9DINO|nr:NMA1 [Symbiodinium natans]